ncbi:MAG: cell wall hydrolase [Halothiobacillaceae bacterium]|nr:MAG: cell wall hydrolase [Halothiobacillaceae bacterium]
MFVALSFAWPIHALAASVKEEINCLALNIYHEARGEPHDGQMAIAYVTMNRVVSGQYPMTVCGVVWQRGQFSWTHDGRSDQPSDKTAWERAKRLAAFLYTNYFRFMAISKGATDLTGGALHFYAPKKVNPSWTKSMVSTREIGSHIFLKEDDS